MFISVFADEKIYILEDTLIAVSDVFKASVNLLQNSMKSQYNDLSRVGFKFFEILLSGFGGNFTCIHFHCLIYYLHENR